MENNYYELLLGKTSAQMIPGLLVGPRKLVFFKKSKLGQILDLVKNRNKRMKYNKKCLLISNKPRGASPRRDYQLCSEEDGISTNRI